MLVSYVGGAATVVRTPSFMLPVECNEPLSFNVLSVMALVLPQGGTLDRVLVHSFGKSTLCCTCLTVEEIDALMWRFID